ncbi:MULTISPECIES: hypothetical protein [Bacillus cereus group]|uniref:Bacteriocin n=1 Tax=Bacillus thuringiensis serovar toumanoffi TaxID=180862 RepID=A0ABD5HRZ8_BACTU|nr:MULTISPECIES: hypothetical protein [Bacillus cereus group]EEM92321.1 hypothetical protein bthur0013_63410 [Bacillus thuringiensis IBL 200]MBU4643049.1 hypothetical protein [Bacillus toyonensis]MCR6784532.1 hypothetical protein [Bacillus thuringiensis]MCR6863178.1 hypothetical protein [Bacillus thuringiensis]MCR6869440.1 hypothetical protein [Bacillus thuringiensis]
MKLNTIKLQEMSKKEAQEINGGVGIGDMITISQTLWSMTKEYSKGPGPAMEMQYKHGMPGGKW